MTIYEGKDYKEICEKAAEIIASEIRMNPRAVLGLSTGSTPIGVYDRLAKWYEQGQLDFSKVTTINLDEYKGLGEEHEQGYRFFMNQYLFDRVNIQKSRTFVPDGTEMDSDKACREYEEIIAEKGRIDLQLLGLGANGHIGFNEPGDAFIADTHCVQLTESTGEANSRFFRSKEEVPKEAYSMGIKGIMQARHIILLASGKQKAQALYEAVYGEITPRVPASILKLHPHTVVFADEDALSVIKEKHKLSEAS